MEYTPDYSPTYPYAFSGVILTLPNGGTSDIPVNGPGWGDFLDWWNANGQPFPITGDDPNALTNAQSQQTTTVQNAFWGLIASTYNLDSELYLLKELVYAWKLNLTNRAAYISAHDAWEGTLFNARVAAQNAIAAATTAAQAVAIGLAQTQTLIGSLDASGNLTGLASTALLYVGAVVTGPGITGTATVKTVAANSVTLTGGTYTVQTSQSYTFTLPTAPACTPEGAAAITN